MVLALALCGMHLLRLEEFQKSTKCSKCSKCSMLSVSEPISRLRKEPLLLRVAQMPHRHREVEWPELEIGNGK